MSGSSPTCETEDGWTPGHAAGSPGLDESSLLVLPSFSGGPAAGGDGVRARRTTRCRRPAASRYRRDGVNGVLVDPHDAGSIAT
jgi:hypothetical protein